MGAELFHVDRRTDMTKVIVVSAILRTRLWISTAPPPISGTATCRLKSVISCDLWRLEFRKFISKRGARCSPLFASTALCFMCTPHTQCTMCIRGGEDSLIEGPTGCRTSVAIGSLCQLPCYVDQSFSQLAPDVELFIRVVKVKQSHYRPGQAQRVPGS